MDEPAAIWARVSDPKQEKVSPEGQVERVRSKLVAMGYSILYVLKRTWTSTDLRPCPEFQELQTLIRDRKIQAVGMLDRDRIEANGRQRLNFLADCKENNVEPIVCQGPPFLEGPEGEIVELALALGKQRANIRAQTGAKQGLEDRARLKGLPPTVSKCYGYELRDGKYVPTEDHGNCCLMFNLALQGVATKNLAKELYRRGIKTSHGGSLWQPSAIKAILVNPLYAGKPAALRYERVIPKQRRKNKAGKTSARLKPMDEWYWLPIEVKDGPITWDQYLALLHRFKLNRLFASRNAKHDYLLRGLIQCEVCARQGYNRHYYGVQRSGQEPAYVCSAMWGQTFGSYGKKCPSKAIPCAEIEQDVKDKIRGFLESPEIYTTELEQRSQVTERTIADIEQNIRHNEAEYRKTISEERYKLEKLTPEAFEQEQILLQARRNWLREENERLEVQLAALQQYDLKQEMVVKMREYLRENLDRATVNDWRFILESLDTKVVAHGDGTWDVEISVPAPDVLIENKTAWCISPCSRPALRLSLIKYRRCGRRRRMILLRTGTRPWRCPGR